MTTTYIIGVAAIMALAVFVWLLSLWKRNAGIVDSFWSLFFLLASVIFVLLHPHNRVFDLVVLVLVALWALRLSGYITWRNHGQPEDRRYADIRQRYSPGFEIKSLFIIFIFQGVLASIIVLPLWATLTGGGEFDMLFVAALLLWIVGMFFEVVGDAQLAKFKSNNRADDAVMDSGLWRYTRHPNYFGEACIWWSYYLLAVNAGAWWTIVSPLLMTWLLLKFSGVSLLEKDITSRKPQYRDYIRRTSAFLPLPPRVIQTAGGTEREVKSQ